MHRQEEVDDEATTSQALNNYHYAAACTLRIISTATSWYAAALISCGRRRNQQTDLGSEKSAHRGGPGVRIWGHRRIRVGMGGVEIGETRADGFEAREGRFTSSGVVDWLLTEEGCGRTCTAFIHDAVCQTRYARALLLCLLRNVCVLKGTVIYAGLSAPGTLRRYFRGSSLCR
eukprot:7937522-Pyramimonas_sp.AAC.1